MNFRPCHVDFVVNKIFTLLITLTLALFSVGQAFGANTLKNCANMKDAVEIQNGVFIRSGNDGILFQNEDIANIGFIVGEKEIAVIDTGGSLEEGQQLLCQIKNASDLPVRYVINTHVHPDHTLGNGAFDDPEIIFIGHVNLPHAMGILSKTYLRRYNETTGENLPGESIILPQLKVVDEIQIDLGNRPVSITAIQKAHTNNDLLVNDKKTATLWLSDLLFHKHIPVIGKSGSVGGWLAVINKLKQLTFSTLVPGHGPIHGNWHEAFEHQTRYLTILRDDIRKNIQTDADLSVAMKTIGLSESDNWNMFSAFHRRNISYIFSDLEWE